MTDGSGGYIVALLTDSYVVRAFTGTLTAVVLSLLVIRFARIRSSNGRRMLILAPIVTALVAALASRHGQFLPTILVMDGATAQARGSVMDVLGESRHMTQSNNIGVLLAAYTTIVSLLLLRRVAGAVKIRRLLSRASTSNTPGGYDRTMRSLQRLCAELEISRTPRLFMVPNCPGGAFTTGWRRPALAIDPFLLRGLDDQELEGLLAHELAHLYRNDPAIGLAVGVVRDAAFFLPGVHIAARWLCTEQEESADELAATVTHRPAALASGLLKVWNCKQGRAPAGVCAVVGARAVWSPTDPMTVVTRRIERLISAAPAATLWRRRAEVGAGVLATSLAISVALAAPAWMSQQHADLLGFFYLSSGASPAPESPAFATFRHLTQGDTVQGIATGAPDAAAAPTDAAAASTGATSPGLTSELDGLGASGDTSGLQQRSTGVSQGVSQGASQGASLGASACPCVPSPSQLAMGQSATPVETGGSSWGPEAWTLQYLDNQADLEATRRLMLMDGPQQLGFLTAGRSERAEVTLPAGALR